MRPSVLPFAGPSWLAIPPHDKRSCRRCRTCGRRINTSSSLEDWEPGGNPLQMCGCTSQGRKTCSSLHGRLEAQLPRSKANKSQAPGKFAFRRAGKAHFFAFRECLVQVIGCDLEAFMKASELDLILKLRLAVARLGETDRNACWNSYLLSRTGQISLGMMFPRTTRIAQARSAFLVARERCQSVLGQIGRESCRERTSMS